jgi:short-subunit dehydrogenase
VFICGFRSRVRFGSDTVAVVTGAASGIGRGVALELAGRGCALALVDRDGDGLAETQRQLGAARSSTHVVDVAQRAAMAALPDAVLAAHGAVHVVINNAGVSVAAPLQAMALDDLDWLMGVNFWGTVHACKFFLPHLLAAPAARIGTVLSDFALFSLPTKSAYCASKFALRGFSEALRAELAETNVRLTCAYPGPVDTGLVSRGRAWDTDKQALEARFVAARALPVAEVARRICAAVERGRPRVLIGRETIAIDLAMRLMPAATGTLVGKLRRRVPFL